jgi:hypothetical protein
MEFALKLCILNWVFYLQKCYFFGIYKFIYSLSFFSKGEKNILEKKDFFSFKKTPEGT